MGKGVSTLDKLQKARRKQIGDEYMQTHRPMGVYQIRNVENGKVFIDSSLNLDGACNKEMFILQMGNHVNKELQKEWKEFGKDKFVFEVLERIKPQEERVTDQSELKKYRKLAADLELNWIEQIQPFNERGYHKKRV
ncbi:hypothetical protein SAMN04488542_12448 [Fontibacillus panacisegetis]|uniref:GIY-YIG catalytic domain-containing protein n=1 Tax=Fontibacillus panacisegetis TaxID=670482 RepID=A0A1G7R1B2_9BACL|nr:GIY-YIG nuclease family protein [Fontibacillus panacisegetis]SDG04494.1 hypothetical protein SAMN04488542_12448 [Fontibacillus panacisegetis]